MKQLLRNGMTLLLCLGCLFSCSLAVELQPIAPEETAFINEPYVFEMVPGTAEWASLDSSKEMVAACYIPQEYIESATTEALLETVLDYPLLIDIFAYDTSNLGIEMASTYLLGLPELLSRSDALEVIGSYMEAYPGDSSDIKYQYCKALVHYLLPEPLVEMRTITYGTVYTPKGTSVSVMRFNSWNDYSTYRNIVVQESDVQEQENVYKSTYTDATWIGGYTYKYNCHAYAWCPNEYSSGFWLEDPYPFTADGSYVEGRAVAGSIIVYKEGSRTVHSGRVVGSGFGSPIVQSKWGANGLVRHASDRCPYYNAQVACVYWERS